MHFEMNSIIALPTPILIDGLPLHFKHIATLMPLLILITNDPTRKATAQGQVVLTLSWADVIPTCYVQAPTRGMLFLFVNEDCTRMCVAHLDLDCARGFKYLGYAIDLSLVLPIAA